MKYNSRKISFFGLYSMLCIALGLLFLASCSNKEKSKETKFQRDLPEIKSDSILNIITTYSPTSYFLYKGEPMGYEYEMAKNLADHLNLELEVTIANNVNEVFEFLENGKGDLAAFGLTITQDRKKQFNFTDFLYLTHQVLVQRKPDNWRQLPKHKTEQLMVRDLYELIGDTVTVIKGTPYVERLKNLSNEIGGEIHTAEIGDDVALDALIGKVDSGSIKYTVSDYNLAMVDQSFYENIDINTRLSLNQQIGWGVRKNSPQLLDTVNAWLDTFKKEDLYQVIYNKYFQHKKSFQPRLSSDFFTLHSGKISPYDKLFRKAGQSMGWDWRLLAAQVYQESQFNPNSEGRLGAAGLLQLMPETASDLGVANSLNPEQNVMGGSRYLKDLQQKFGEVPDTLQQIKFTLAAFNSGLGHVRDAQRLASSLGKDSLIWDNNVEKAMIKLTEKEFYTRPEVRYGFVRGSLPYNYVKEIFERFEHYKNLVLWKPENGEEVEDE